MTARITLDTRRCLSSGSYPLQVTVSYQGRVYRLKVSEMSREQYEAATRKRNPDKAWRDRFAAWERRANLILADLEVFSWERFKDEWRGKHGEGEFLQFYLQGHSGKVSTQRVYRAAAASFLKAWGNIRVVEITPERVEAWANRCGHSPNTITSYLRCLRAALNEAHKAGYLKQPPDLTVEATRPREGYLKPEEMKALIEYRTLHPKEQEARDLFLLSYYCFAVNFRDMLKWTGDNIDGESITYKRSKTGKAVRIPLTGDVFTILNRYGSTDCKGKQYLLKYLRGAFTEKEQDKRVNKVLSRTRYHLRRIAERLELEDITRFRPSILRQTVVNTLLAQGVEPTLITWMMGTSVENAGRHYFEPGAFSDLSKKLAL